MALNSSLTTKGERIIGRGIERVGGPHNAALGLLGVAFFSMAVIVEWPYAEGSLLKFLDLIPPTLLASPTWAVPVTHGLTEMLKTAEGVRELARWVMIDAGIGIVAGALHKVSSRIVDVLGAQYEERKRLGIEPLKPDQIPSHVYIGPAQIASDLARQAAEKDRITHDDRHPIIVVHPDEVVPARYGQEVDYHFRAVDVNQILDTFPPSRKEISFIEASGIDRAPELTFICINPENAVFYGYDAHPQAPPAFVSSLIKKIPKEKLVGKTINVIMPQVAEIGETSRIIEELQALAKQLQFKLNFTEPEELFIERMEEKIRAIGKQKKEGESVKITILGQGGEERDRLMLKRMGKALAALKPSREVKVNIVQRLRQSDEEEEKLRTIFKRSDYIICYGDEDTGTTSLVRLLIEHFKVPKEKIGAVIEKISMFYDVSELNEKDIFCIYQMVIDEFSGT